MTIDGKVIHGKSALHYVKAGKGQHTLLFFHGFGQDHSVYLPLVQTLAPHCTLFIFDLYFHGESKWDYGEEPLEKQQWKETMTSFLGEQSITTFSLVGFSMGGKFALATFEAFPAQCKNIFLIAPDGIKTSFWYSMATYPLLLRRFFKSLIGNYNRFEALTKFLHKYRLVDQGLIRFADYQMGSEHKRKRVYYSWVVFRHLKFNMKSIARLINQHKVNAVIIVGEYDRVIEPKNMTRFLQHLDRYRFEVLPSGHSGLIYQSLPFIKEQL